jgi:predicted DNA-binding transcriptional regulator AlpA
MPRPSKPLELNMSQQPIPLSDRMLLRTREAAELLSVSVKTLRAGSRTGRYPKMIVIGPYLHRWSVKALQDWLEEHERANMPGSRKR